MLQIKNLTITHKKDLRPLLEDFNFTLNTGDRAVIISEEGNGKSTLLKLIYDEQMAAVSSSVNIVTTFGELNGKVGEFRLAKSLSSLTEIKRALALLKKYQMIELIDVLEELNEHTRIIIYPCINLVLMREDILKLLNSFSEEEAVPDANEEEEGEMPDGDTADTDNAAGEFTDPDAGYTDSGDADAGYTDAGYTDAEYTDTAAD